MTAWQHAVCKSNVSQNACDDNESVFLFLGLVLTRALFAARSKRPRTLAELLPWAPFGRKFNLSLFPSYNLRMKTLQSSLCLALIVFIASGSGLADQVTLQSQDGQDFKVEVKVARKSGTIKNLIKDAGVEAPIPMPNITGKVLAKIAQLMKHAVERPFHSDRALLIYLDELLAEKALSIQDLLDVIRAINYLDIRSQREGDALNASLKLYGDRIFGHTQLEKVARLNAAAYDKYIRDNLSLPRDLQRIVVRESLQSIDRIFLDTTPDRRIRAINETPVAVAQVIAYIAKNQVPSAAALPETMRDGLTRWQGADFASKIHFGPWPTEFATWPGHCPLPSDLNYNMYSNATPDDRFIDNGDGTVTDACTKLTWEQSPSLPPSPFQQSLNHCAKLNKAGFTDWRAPTRIELQSTVNYAATDPALNPVFHEGNARYWSSTPAFGYQNEAWTVNFAQGHVSAQAIADNNRMRCVRGERGGAQTAGAKNHYTYAQHSETVTDNFTGAAWQRQVTGEGPDHDEGRDHVASQNYCENLVLDRKGGWLLPTVKALSTLIDVNVGEPRIDRQAFSATPERRFWSSSPRVGLPDRAWGVNFDLGDVLDSRVFSEFRARCVR